MIVNMFTKDDLLFACSHVYSLCIFKTVEVDPRLERIAEFYEELAPSYEARAAARQQSRKIAEQLSI